jgi:citrate lyase subunit beta / citryl-CoA lyase
MSHARSWLYVPGNRRAFLDRAADRGTDALIVDLEDSVPPADKSAARETVWLRLNSESPDADLQILTAGVTGVVVPKADPELVAGVGELLAGHERRLGIPACRLAIVPLIETARGMLTADQLASMPRVAHLAIGEADLCAELRLRPSDTSEELGPLRLRVVVASAAAGIGAPIAPTSTDFRDLQALRTSTEALLRSGFRARTAIHPAQVPVINDVFSPSAEEVAEARRLVDAFDRSPSGVITDARGRMVDVAVVRSARELLDRA